MVLPDADQTARSSWPGWRLALRTNRSWRVGRNENGVEVLVPTLIDRTDQWSGNSSSRNDQSNARIGNGFIAKRARWAATLCGYEVRKVFAAVDWFQSRRRNGSKIGVAGYGEGGLIAFYAAAADPRIDACLVSGYFDQRTHPWEEPLYRNVWSLLQRKLGDAEIAAMIAPRGTCDRPQAACS